MARQPYHVVIRAISSGAALETLPILEDTEATAAAPTGSNWATPALLETMRKRAATALARLRGFRSLEKVELAVDASGDPKPSPVGALELSAGTKGDGLVVALRDASGAVVHSEPIGPYRQGTRDVGMDKPVPCTYEPTLRAAYRDPVQRALFVEIGFRYAEGCDTSTPRFVRWPLDAASPDRDELRKIVTQQFDLVGVNATARDDELTGDAVSIGTAGLVDDLKLFGVADHAMDYSGHTDHDVEVTLSCDGKSAWASETTKIALLERDSPGRDAPWRASDVLVKTPNGWRIAALAWTEPVANADVERDAKAGKLAAVKLDGDPGDASLRAAFDKLTTDGVDQAAATRADLVVLGSGPGERTVGGAAFARAWNAGWKGKVTIASSIARAMPSGTTGWVVARITLAKPGYKIPFTAFCVFDKTADGSWSLVHVHFAT